MLCLPLIAALASAPLANADVIASADQRFAKPSDETPSFQRHVLPLMGRLGCNGRACHGSFQGQGGFRLSLFGYDFKADHDALLGGDNPRVDVKNPANSLALKKPLRVAPHKGGKLLEPGAWQTNLITRWIQSGATAVQDKDAEFVSLSVEPREILFEKVGQTVPIRVTAVWSDGTREIVTPLSRFRTNDETIATIDENGLVTSMGKGATDVVAFYDNGVVPVQVLLPVSEKNGAQYPKIATPTKVDELVVAQLRKLGILPSDLCTDAEFLRRVSIDMTGTLPSPREIEAFLADKRPNKRDLKIDELLARPAYAAWWATRFSDWTGNSPALGTLGGERMLNGEKSYQWYRWFFKRLADNMPYDKIVEGVVLATSRQPDQSYEDYCKEMGTYFRTKGGVDFAERPTMPHYWMRKTLGSSDGKALAFAHSFLGVSLQCAQCHKHPYDQWTKQDFDQFAAFFNGVSSRTGPRDLAKVMKDKVGLTMDEDSGTYGRLFVKFAEEGTLLPYKELVVPPPQKAKPNRPAAKGPSGRVLTPRLLGGEEVIASNYNDPRQPLMDWMRDAEHPYFARAIVNRIWGGYFNTPLIDPPDDLNLANPPSNPALLDYLCKGFIESGFDLRWLHRQIAGSQAYQRSWKPNDTNLHDERQLSRAVLRRMPAEVMYDSLVLATASEDVIANLHKDPIGVRAIGYPRSAGAKKDTSSYAIALFGKPARVINCDCERSSEPSLLQTVYLRNDGEVLKMLDRPDGWLKQISKAKDLTEDALVRSAYLRTLSRLPDDRELARSVQHLKDASDRTSGMRDLMWALVNTKEFAVNR